MSSKNRHSLKKLNNEELKDINGGFYVCVVNDNIADAIVLAENPYEDEIVKTLGEERGESTIYIVNYLYEKGFEGHLLHLNEWAEVGCVIEILQEFNRNQLNV